MEDGKLDENGNFYAAFTDGNGHIIIDSRLEFIIPTLQSRASQIASQVREEWLKREVEFQEQVSNQLVKEGVSGDELAKRILEESVKEEKRLLKERVEASIQGDQLTNLVERGKAISIWIEVQTVRKILTKKKKKIESIDSKSLQKKKIIRNMILNGDNIWPKPLKI